MRIVLINPPRLYLSQPESQAPLGLLYVAASLEAANHNVSISNLANTPLCSVSLPPADVYGITGSILDIHSINTLVNSTDKPVIVGGGCTLVKELIDSKAIIVKGEGEHIIHKVLNDLPNANRLYKAKRIKTLDQLPYPARHMLDCKGGNIFNENTKYKGEGSTVIITSRGCPHKCAFCSSPAVWGSATFRSPENVVSEVKSVQAKYNIHQFRFSDDGFTAIPKRAKKIAKLLKPLGIYWRISVRVNPHSYEMFKAFYDAGCRQVSFGVESFDQNVLDRLNKRIKTEDSINAIKTAKDAGLVVRILLMINTPGQTAATTTKNIKALEHIESYIDSVACTTFMPLPGCDIWKRPNYYGIEIVNKDYTNYNFYMFDKSGLRDMPMAISHLDRDDAEVISESLNFRKYLVNTNKVNRG